MLIARPDLDYPGLGQPQTAWPRLADNRLDRPAPGSRSVANAGTAWLQQLVGQG
jgi:hypothetical protein